MTSIPLSSAQKYADAHPWNAIFLAIETEFWQIQNRRCRRDMLINKILDSIDEYGFVPTIIAVVKVFSIHQIGMDSLVFDLADSLMPGIRYEIYQTLSHIQPRVVLDQPPNSLPEWMNAKEDTLTPSPN